eukprot:gene18329-biopygen9943
MIDAHASGRPRPRAHALHAATRANATSRAPAKRLSSTSNGRPPPRVGWVARARLAPFLGSARAAPLRTVCRR